MLLKDYLELHVKTSVNKQIFASNVGISLTSLYAYASGKRTPPLTLAQIIVDETKNKVTLKELTNFYKEKENGRKEKS